MKLDLSRLKAERIAKNLSQDEMATAMGWKTRTPYSKRESGRVEIGINEFVKIINILGYKISDAQLFFK